jgi:iduronate 2-sulfatase
VLFIAVDDLRPELGCYGSPIAKSPNLDSLAAAGLRFNRAYCQQAICGPSRASLMTGARPDTIGVVENSAYFRDLNPDIITLPQHFIANGYETVYSGKIYHGRMTDEEHSWSRRLARNEQQARRPATPGGYALKENQETYLSNQKVMQDKYGEQQWGLIHGPAYESADVPDNFYADGFKTDQAIATLAEMVKEGEQPFFLGLGLVKPHLDFKAPKRYWDLYDPAEIKLATQTEPPKNGSATGLHASFELRTRHGIPKSGPIGDELARTLLHGYYACVSYIDAQIGRMVKALEEHGVRDNTIIIVWGDHGWHLGDMGIWGKATNYEIAARVPLIIWTPGMKDGTRGQSSDALVELIDMYPTLCDLAGLEKPSHLEGHSFAALLEDPQREWKKAAFSQFPNPALREWAANPLSKEMRQTFFGPLIEEVEQRIIAQQGDAWDRKLFENHLIGYSMRTPRYRFVSWRDTRSPAAPPLYTELYDHETDPKETTNIASENSGLVKTLTEQLEAGWESALP